MSPVRLIILGLIILFSVLAAHRREKTWYLLFAVTALAGIALQLALYGANLSSPRLDAFDVLGAIVDAFLAAEAFGLPLPVARRLRIGLHSPEWEYDRRLLRVGREVDRLFRSKPDTSDIVGYAAWRDRLVSEGPVLVTKLRRMSAPDENWRDLTLRMARYYEEVVLPIRNGARSEDGSAWNREASEIQERWEELRRQYRTAANAMLHGSDP